MQGGFDMWVNIDLQKMDNESVLMCLDYIASLSNEELVLSFNTIDALPDFEHRLNELLIMCEISGIKFKIGPQFVGEGILESGKLIHADELVFLTLGEKVVWYFNRFVLDIEIVVIINDCLEVDPVIVKSREEMFDNNHKYLFMYENIDTPGIEYSKKATDYTFIRMINKKEV